MIETIDVTLRESIYTHLLFSYESALRFINQLDKIPFLNTIELGYADVIGTKAALSEFNEGYVIEARKTTAKNISIMFKLDNFVENKNVWNKTLWDNIDMVRIMSSRDLSMLKDSVKYFHDKGIITSVNHSYISRMSDDEKKYLLERVSESNADIFYIADTNGSMFEDDIANLLQMVRKECGEKIKIGFHAHNHYQMAAANAYFVIKHGIDLLDGTISGFGKGAGNLPLELIPILAEKFQQYKITIDDLLSFDLITKYFDSITNSQYSSYESYVNLLYAYRNMNLNEFNVLLNDGQYNNIGERMIYYDK